MFRIDRYHLSRKTALLLTADVALATAVLAAAYVLRRETDPALVPFAIFLAGFFLRFIPERRAPRPVLVLGGGRLA
ncbi:MAG TPA: hypothetical protein VLB27_03935, partial [candidate division Zixibacteria bacterium]|nr:hypothetical protein [candidate division Zixibacteria bacterium]